MNYLVQVFEYYWFDVLVAVEGNLPGTAVE